MTQKLAVHACACADNGGEKRNVLIVSVLLPIDVNLALRSKTQRRIDVHGMRFQTVLLHVATAPQTVVGHGQVEDQAPAARCILEVAAELHVAAPLACACRYTVPLTAAPGPCVRPCGTAALALLPSNHVPWLHLSEHGPEP
jgi:hypothetical protein